MRNRYSAGSSVFAAAAFFAVVFFAAGFLAAVFFAGAFLAAALASLAAAFFSASISLPGQLKFGHSFHGPRAVVTMTMGAPQCSQTSSVAVMAPYYGSG